MKIINSKDLGLAIKNRRKKLGYTQSNVSELTGLSASFISEAENGKETAEIGKILMLANVLGLDVLTEERGK